MGVGKAQRRRAKNAEIANVSLHKAALGKRGASAHIPLPSAPTKDDYKDRMPASLRKMLALKEAVEQPLKRRKFDEGRSQLPSGVLPQDSSSSAPTGKKKRKLLEEPAQQQDQHLEQKQAQQHHQKERNQAQEQQRQQAQAVQGAAAVWQEPKRLKQKKKEYLKAKQLKKKGKHRPAADDLDLQSDRPAFGEVVHAPPVVALKSKHWAAGNKQQQQPQQQQQQQHSGAHAAKGSSRKSRQKQGMPTQERAKDPELDDVREQMIEMYRAGRPLPSEGQATLQSLKALVKRQVATG